MARLGNSNWNKIWNTKKILPIINSEVIINSSVGFYSNSNDTSFPNNILNRYALNSLCSLGLNNWLLCDNPGPSVMSSTYYQTALADGTFTNNPQRKFSYSTSLPIITNNILSIIWNTVKKSYAIEFTVTVDYTSDSGKSSVTYSVANNANLVTYISVDTEYMQYITIEVQKWSLPNDYAIINNITAGYSIYADNKNIKSIKTEGNLAFYSTEFPSMNFTITLYNENDDYNPTNPTAKFKNSLIKGTEVIFSYIMPSEGLSSTGCQGAILSVELSQDHNYIDIKCGLKMDLYTSKFDMTNLGTTFPLTTTINDILTAIFTQNNITDSKRDLQLDIDNITDTITINSDTGMSCSEFLKMALLSDNTLKDLHSTDSFMAFYLLIYNNTYNANDIISIVNNSTTINNSRPNLDLISLTEEPTIEIKEHIYSVNINNGAYVATDNNYSDHETLELTFPVTSSNMQTMAENILKLYNKYNKRVSGKFRGNPELFNPWLYTHYFPMITTKYGTHPFYPTHIEITYDGGFSGTFEAILLVEDN